MLQAARGKVFEANCIFAGVCAPQVFVYSPGMYSPSNQDFVRGTVSSFYEMFKQTVIRRSDQETEEDQFKAFVLDKNASSANDDGAADRVCPMDDMEWELKVRNQAMKKGCASVQMDGLKKALFMIRIVVDTVVQVMYIIMQIATCLFRLVIPTNGETERGQIRTELEFWFNKLILLVVESIKQLANMLFNLIFTSGPLGSVMKNILKELCNIVKIAMMIWNETGEFQTFLGHVHMRAALCVCVCVCV